LGSRAIQLGINQGLQQVKLQAKDMLPESSLRAKLLRLLGSEDAKIVILQPLNAVSWLTIHRAVN
jgi:hypothetical protein